MNHLLRLGGLAHSGTAIEVDDAVIPVGFMSDRVELGTEQAIRGGIGVALDGGLGILVDQATAVAAIERCLVKHRRVFNVETRVAHNSDHRVLTSRELLEVDELNGARLHHGLVRVDEVVEERIDAVTLIPGNRAHGLLSHGALVRVARTLVVMRVRDEAGADSQQGERLNLQMTRLWANARFVDGNVAVVLFVHVQILNKALVHEILKHVRSFGEQAHVFRCNGGLAFPDDDVRTSGRKGTKL